MKSFLKGLVYTAKTSNLDWLTEESPYRESNSYLVNEITRIRSISVFLGGGGYSLFAKDTDHTLFQRIEQYFANMFRKLQFTCYIAWKIAEAYLVSLSEWKSAIQCH